MEPALLSQTVRLVSYLIIIPCFMARSMILINRKMYMDAVIYLAMMTFVLLLAVVVLGKLTNDPLGEQIGLLTALSILTVAAVVFFADIRDILVHGKHRTAQAEGETAQERSQRQPTGK